MEEELVALRQARRSQVEEEVGPLYSTRQVPHARNWMDLLYSSSRRWRRRPGCRGSYRS